MKPRTEKEYGGEFSSGVDKIKFLFKQLIRCDISVHLSRKPIDLIGKVIQIITIIW